MKILVAVDGSAHAEAAVRVAAGLVRGATDSLRIVTVVPSFVGMDLEMAPRLNQDLGLALVARGKKHLEEAAALARVAGGIEAVTQLVTGESVPSMILEVLEQQGIDLVVLGSRGHGAVSFLLGSVAARIVQQAPCSVYVVKLPAAA
ncbi:MAG: hypothetical protein BWK76_24925 [Desulfobulbaceae bacterium A2]|nr:MAG: hypothetical protein BWK76_24925 [Desulfobulbaceae bacterium A2]